jgi:MFS transporter, MCT family, solute carrier family 16 (monocarboxylic acid transporters), member 10
MLLMVFSAWIGSLQFALIFMPGSVTGRLLDMGHHKLPQGLAAVLLIVCAFLTAECKEYWQFLLCQGIGMGVRNLNRLCSLY